MPKVLNQTSNKSSRTLRKFIRLVNLVSFEEELNFYAWELDLSEEEQILMTENSYLFLVSTWAKKHNLEQYPKLFRYLSLTAKRGLSWQTAFEDFKKIREFMKIFLEIAEHYQEVHKNTQTLINHSKETGNQFLINMSETRILERDFSISYTNSNILPGSGYERFRAFQSEQVRPGLAKRLFDIAFSFLSLTVDGNHQANISLGGFLDAIKGTDLRRLKKCIVCSKIFWASRLNTVYCSKKCSNAHHQKLMRSNLKRRNEVNEKRRGNYAYKHAMKKTNL